MTRRLRLLALAAVAVSAVGLAILPATAPVRASVTVLCAPDVAGGVQGPRRVTNPNTSTSYNINSAGCGIIGSADVGYFVSQGYTAGPSMQTVTFTTGVLSGTTSVQGPNLPASTYLREIIVDNTTANAVTGGIDFGKTTGAADVASALTCGANCLTFVADSALLLRVFSKTAVQPIFITGHTAGNSANLTVTFVYGYF